jgi:hypothetical protein
LRHTSPDEGSCWFSAANYPGLWPPGKSLSISATVKLEYGESPMMD